MTRAVYEPGEVIGGKYRLIRSLGQGAHGCVFEASHADGANVAIKLLHDDLDPVDWLRFEREAVLLKRIDHANVVRLLDFGTDRSHYMVCELLIGRSLKAELGRVGFMSCARVAGIMRQVLDALAEAHRLGIVHRDLKPANIQLCECSETVDRIKVIDFGVAKTLHDPSMEALTSPGAMVGSPSYMSPEQVRGQADIGLRADLFALGLMMAEMLDGHRLAGDSMMEVIRTHLGEGPLEVPRSVQLSVLGPVIKRALERQPDDRFESAVAMRTALNAPLSAPAPTSASGTLLMPDHLEGLQSSASTVPLDDVPWLKR
jgi:serine/threonine protein kinase